MVRPRFDFGAIVYGGEEIPPKYKMELDSILEPSGISHFSTYGEVGKKLEEQRKLLIKVYAIVHEHEGLKNACLCSCGWPEWIMKELEDFITKEENDLNS